jgi:hypothetical protein
MGTAPSISSNSRSRTSCSVRCIPTYPFTSPHLLLPLPPPRPPLCPLPRPRRIRRIFSAAPPLVKGQRFVLLLLPTPPPLGYPPAAASRQAVPLRSGRRPWPPPLPASASASTGARPCLRGRAMCCHPARARPSPQACRLRRPGRLAGRTAAGRPGPTNAPVASSRSRSRPSRSGGRQAA